MLRKKHYNLLLLGVEVWEICSPPGFQWGNQSAACFHRVGGGSRGRKAPPPPHRGIREASPDSPCRTWNLQISTAPIPERGTGFLSVLGVGQVLCKGFLLCQTAHFPVFWLGEAGFSWSIFFFLLVSIGGSELQTSPALCPIQKENKQTNRTPHHVIPQALTSPDSPSSSCPLSETFHVCCIMSKDISGCKRKDVGGMELLHFDQN